MKKTLAILLTCAFAFGGFAACGDRGDRGDRGDPCEKFANKLEDCAKKADKKDSKDDKEGKKKFIEECKKTDKLKKKAKECVGKDSCEKMMECFFKE
ncbi:MAG: hypothetical protein RBU30_15250 [Polyangia bacterium]|jgi:hypothetical protein|nr:hypothetical protein [Polyangia bacterium]